MIDSQDHQASSLHKNLNFEGLSTQGKSYDECKDLDPSTPRTTKRVTLVEEPTHYGPAYTFFPTPTPRGLVSSTNCPASSHALTETLAPLSAMHRKGKPPPPKITLLSVSWNQKPDISGAPGSFPAASMATSRQHPHPLVQPSPRSVLKKPSSNVPLRRPLPVIDASFLPDPLSVANSSTNLPLSHSNANRHIKPPHLQFDGRSDQRVPRGGAAGVDGGSRTLPSPRPRPPSLNAISPRPGTSYLAPLYEGDERQEESAEESSSDEEMPGGETRRLGYSSQVPLSPPPPSPPCRRTSPPPSTRLSVQQFSSDPSGSGRRASLRQLKGESAIELQSLEEGWTEEEINREVASPRRRSSSTGMSSPPPATTAVRALSPKGGRAEGGSNRPGPLGKRPPALPLASPPLLSPATSSVPPSSMASSLSCTPSASLPPRRPDVHRCISGYTHVDAGRALRRHLALGPFTSGLEWTMLAGVATGLLSAACVVAEKHGFFMGFNDFEYTTAGDLNLIDLSIGWNRFSMDVNGMAVVTLRPLSSISRMAYLLGCLTFAGHLLSVCLSAILVSFLHQVRSQGRISPLAGAFVHTRLISGCLIFLSLFLAGVSCIEFRYVVLRDFNAEFRDAPQMEGFRIKPGWAYFLTVTVSALCLLMGGRLGINAGMMDKVLAHAAAIGTETEDPLRKPKRGQVHHFAGPSARSQRPPRPAFLSV